MNNLLFEEHLRNSGIPFSAEDKDLFLSITKPLFIKKGTKVVLQNSTNHLISYIVKGIMRLYYVIGDKEYTIKFFFEERWAGDYLSIMAGRTSMYFLEAATDCQLLQLSKEDLEFLYDKSHMIERYGRKMIEAAFFDFVNELTARDQKKSSDYYLEFIQNHPEILEAVPLKLIANYLNIQPESLSRIRRQLAKGR